MFLPVEAEFPADGLQACYKLKLNALSAAAELQLTSVFDLTNWRATPVRWVSPLHMRVHGLPKDLCTICALQVGEEMCPLKLAADHCFYDVGKVPLVKLAEHMKPVVDVVKTDPKLKVCTELIKAIWRVPDGSDKLIDCLASRKFPPDRRNALWKHTGAIGLLDKGDQRRC